MLLVHIVAAAMFFRSTFRFPGCCVRTCKTGTRFLENSGTRVAARIDVHRLRLGKSSEGVAAWTPTSLGAGPS